MTQTAAQEIRDSIITQDIRYRRVDAAVRKEVDARLNKLENALTALMLRIDVAGTKQLPARKRRLAKMKKESGKIIRTAYSEINGILHRAGRRIAKVEAKNINQIVKAQLP